MMSANVMRILTKEREREKKWNGTLAILKLMAGKVVGHIFIPRIDEYHTF